MHPIAAPLCFVCCCASAAQATLQIADQTFKLEGTHEYAYAFAANDQIDLHIELIQGRQIKEVELVRFPDFRVFQTYELDTMLDKSVLIPQTGVYLLRIKEAGLGKKICRFTLHRTPGSEKTSRLDTRVAWDLEKYPQFQVRTRQIKTGIRTEMVPLNGIVTVRLGKMGVSSNVNSYQFTLPPNTVRWAYRIAVGQEALEARRKDAETLGRMLKNGAAKGLAASPTNSLAAFALGMTIELSTSSADVEYAPVNAENQQNFLSGKPYQAEIWQGGISTDAQRRYKPLSGNWFFALKNDNWLEAIDVYIDIEAVAETPVYEEEIYLEAVRP